MDKNWKVILAFTGVFLAGAITGASVSNFWQRGRREWRPDLGRPGIEQFMKSQFAATARKLDLSPEQQEQVKPIIQKAGDEFRQARLKQHTETIRILEAFQAEFSRILNPEQQRRFEQIRNQQRERIQKFLRSQSRPHAGPPPGLPEPPPEGPPPRPQGEPPASP